MKRLFVQTVQDHIWLAENEAEREVLIGKGVSEAVYTYEEIAQMKKLDKEDRMAIHEVKKVFEKSRVLEVTNLRWRR